MDASELIIIDHNVNSLSQVMRYEYAHQAADGTVVATLNLAFTQLRENKEWVTYVVVEDVG